MTITSSPPRFGRFALSWAALWLLTLFVFSLPLECDIISTVSTNWVLGNLPFMAGWELFCAAGWSALSYAIFVGLLSALGKIAARGAGRFPEPPTVRRIVLAAALLGLLELCLIGAPLSRLAQALSHAGGHRDCIEEPTIRDRSHTLESVGILLAFPLASVLTGVSCAWPCRKVTAAARVTE